MSYAGKHIWIIGASSGIGEALAHELAARGAILVLSARSKEKLDALKKTLGSAHSVYLLDVTQSSDVMQTAEMLQKDFPRIDSIVFLAAIYTPMKLASLNIEKVGAIIQTNLLGAFHVVNAALLLFEQQKAGQIALCGSVAGYCGLPNAQPYSATKAGVMNLAESLRSEMGSKIDVKLISPGFVATPMTSKNDFHMPMMIAPEEAARAIADGLLTRQFEIHFPKRFTYIMKLIRLLPSWLYFPLAKHVR